MFTATFQPHLSCFCNSRMMKTEHCSPLSTRINELLVSPSFHFPFSFPFTFLYPFSISAPLLFLSTSLFLSSFSPYLLPSHSSPFSSLILPPSLKSFVGKSRFGHVRFSATFLGQIGIWFLPDWFHCLLQLPQRDFRVNSQHICQLSTPSMHTKGHMDLG